MFKENRTFLKSLGLLASLLVATNICSAPLKQESFLPLPPRISTTPESKLGKKLFNDKRLSGNGNLSCQSCHQQDYAFSQPYQGGIDTPSLWNVVYMDRFFWNGRATSLKQAIHESLFSEAMMSTSKGKLQNLQKDPGLSQAFEAVYTDGFTINNLIAALEAYLSTLTTPGSRFDKFINGDNKILSVDEKKGYDLFVSYGCASCHQGMNVGGNIMERIGVYKNYIHNPNEYDLGLYAITHKEKDRYVFRVPSLRNITKTSPYFHNGSAMNLKEAIRRMAIYQTDRELLSSDVENIAEFLEAMTGDMRIENDAKP